MTCKGYSSRGHSSPWSEFHFLRVRSTWCNLLSQAQGLPGAPFRGATFVTEKLRNCWYHQYFKISRDRFINIFYIIFIYYIYIYFNISILMLLIEIRLTRELHVFHCLVHPMICAAPVSHGFADARRTEGEPHDRQQRRLWPRQWNLGPQASP